MGMHSQQPAAGLAKNPTVMVHQAMIDGSNQLVRWLEPTGAPPHIPKQASPDQVTHTFRPPDGMDNPLVYREVTCPPYGM
eukprot:13820656-Heterocapsa_arctica.AAC.1